MDKQTGPNKEIEPGQEYIIDRFKPEDAPGVARLFLSVYGEGYPIRTYMVPELLIAENKAERIISSVARTTGGDIVGHNALFNSAPHSGTYESGAGLVHGAYRGGKGLWGRLVRHGIDLAATIPTIDAIFGEPVCNHPFSQKLTDSMGFTPMALEVDLMPAAAYEQEASADGRVSAYLCFTSYSEGDNRLYVPEIYLDKFSYLYSGFDDKRQILVSEGDYPDGSATTLSCEIFDFGLIARITVTATGPDLLEQLDNLEQDLSSRGVLVRQIWLPLHESWSGRSVEALRTTGYFLGGALPHWFGSDGILMQKLAAPPQWDSIYTNNDRYRKILEIAKNDWLSLQ